MKLTKSVLEQLIREVLSEADEEDEKEPTGTPKPSNPEITDIPDNPMDDEDKNESITLDLKKEFKQYNTVNYNLIKEHKKR